MIRIYEVHPEIFALFSFSDEDVHTSASLVRMGHSVMQTVNKAVGGLDNLGALGPTLTALGEKHATHGVKKAHFSPVGADLLHTLEQRSGVTWSPEASAAWGAVYEALSAIISAPCED